MSKQLIVIDSPGLTADGFKSVCNLAPGQLDACNSLVDYFGALAGGNQMATVDVKVGAVQASSKITFSGAPTAEQQCYIGNITVTAKSNGATGYEFNIGGSVGVTATNLANMINAQFAGIMSAVALAGAVTITAVVPGVSGNALGISVGNLSNTTLNNSFQGGSDGTTTILTLG